MPTGTSSRAPSCPWCGKTTSFPARAVSPGIGDIVQSVFFSPKAPTAGGLIWGVGRCSSFPPGSDDLLTTDKWGAGPTGVVITQQGPWTVGALANHIWSFAGNSSRADVEPDVLPAVRDLHDPHRNDVLPERRELRMTGTAGNGRCPSIPASRKSCGSAASWCRWVPSRATGRIARTGARTAGAGGSPSRCSFLVEPAGAVSAACSLNRRRIVHETWPLLLLALALA